MHARGPLLLTGAAGLLGGHLRQRLLAKYGSLRSTDVAAAPSLSGDDFRRCDLGDIAALAQVVDGCRTIVHFGAVSIGSDVRSIIDANIVGTLNLFEAARKHGVARIVFASSGHVVGFHLKNGKLDAAAQHRPDSIYGLSKCFGEDLARLYWDKHGIECAVLRLGICGFGTAVGAYAPIWLSEDDLWRLVEASLDAPLVGYSIVYGASNNPQVPWHNDQAKHIAFVPQDRHPAAPPIAAREITDDPASIFIGGVECARGYGRPDGKR